MILTVFWLWTVSIPSKFRGCMYPNQRLGNQVRPKTQNSSCLHYWIISCIVIFSSILYIILCQSYVNVIPKLNACTFVTVSCDFINHKLY